MPTHARERLLEAAERLFYAEGIRAVGVERLLSVSSVGRASFYRHFAGKDDLVATMLREHDERYRSWLTDRVAALGGGPLAVFDALSERSEWTGFRGCAFVNAMAETGDPDTEVYRLASEHKRRIVGLFDDLLVAAGYVDHARLADQFVLLMDGATATALRERTSAPALRAREMAATLLATATDSSNGQGSRHGHPRPADASRLTGRRADA